MTEKKLRELLWLNHGCGFDGLYGDDGEMQCNNIPVHYPIDFKRDSPNLIERKLMERNGKFIQTEHGEIFVPNDMLSEKENIYKESDGTKLEEESQNEQDKRD